MSHTDEGMNSKCPATCDNCEIRFRCLNAGVPLPKRAITLAIPTWRPNTSEQNQQMTQREKWLMDKAFEAACYSKKEFNEWLADSAADGVTVEMVLAKEAP